MAWKHCGCILKSYVFHINTATGIFIEKDSRKQEKFIGMHAQQKWIALQKTLLWNKHKADINYIRIVHGHTFPSGVF